MMDTHFNAKLAKQRTNRRTVKPRVTVASKSEKTSKEKSDKTSKETSKKTTAGTSEKTPTGTSGKTGDNIEVISDTTSDETSDHELNEPPEEKSYKDTIKQLGKPRDVDGTPEEPLEVN